MRPHRWQPTRLPHLWDSPGKNTGVGCHFLLQCMKVKSESEAAQSCPTLSDPMDCSPLSSSHGFFQARAPEWVAIAFFFDCMDNNKLENSMDGGAYWAAVHGVAKSRTRLSIFTFTFRFHSLEKETATHSSVLAWRIPETGEPAGLLSMRLHRVRHN